METWDAIRARRNVRTYQDRAIPDEDLGRILEAARRTPSSINQQAWDFVVVTERDRLRELAKAWRYSAHVAGSAATIALVVPDSDDRDERDTFQYDVGQVTMSIMLAATDLGIGSGHASVGDQAHGNKPWSAVSCRGAPPTVSATQRPPARNATHV